MQGVGFWLVMEQIVIILIFISLTLISGITLVTWNYKAEIIIIKKKGERVI